MLLMSIKHKFKLSADVMDVLARCKGVILPTTREELIALSFGGKDNSEFEVSYDVNGKKVVEANVVRCKNGASINYTEDYMRRRDPDCLIVADDKPTDKPRFEKEYGQPFSKLRSETFKWLKGHKLVLVPFTAGKDGPEGLLIAPENASFFALTLADLQYFVDVTDKKDFEPKVVIFLAPPFRHTFFKGKQVVVHNRTDVYELFSYNLYPGPSAKKGIYGFLLQQSEKEGWVAAHASATKIVTPYENEVVIMHEGASGGGKSELKEAIHREPNGKILYAQNIVKNEKLFISLDEPCELQPISDDITFCKTQEGGKRMTIQDAENGWFLRVDQITGYGTEPELERQSIHPSEPLIFLNLQGKADSTCLIWEHTLDSNGKPCPNPRIVMPRKMIKDIISEPTEVDVRSFGVRTPPCTAEKPSYGIIGMLQFLPPALAWLWRLVAPRGHANPSIVSSGSMESEGIGSYGPFLTGKDVVHANMLLDQILNSSSTRYVLIPNQYIGAYRVGFMPQWISREYLARRGFAGFKKHHFIPSRCPLFGFSLESLKIDGQYIKRSLLQPETQAEVGIAAYDKGAALLVQFFKKELKRFLTPELKPLGRMIIESVMRDAPIEEYLELIPMRY